MNDGSAEAYDFLKVWAHRSMLELLVNLGGAWQTEELGEGSVLHHGTAAGHGVVLLVVRDGRELYGAESVRVAEVAGLS